MLYILFLTFFFCAKKSHHHRQRLKLDLEVESNPLESKFSTSLMDLMQREDSAVASHKYSAVEGMVKKVHAGLCAETTRHCTMQSSSNQARWACLLDQQREERHKMFLESFAAIGAPYNTKQQTDHDKPREQRGKNFTMQDRLEEENQRLKMSAFINFGKCENFNLDNAFGKERERDGYWVFSSFLFSSTKKKKNYYACTLTFTFVGLRPSFSPRSQAFS